MYHDLHAGHTKVNILTSSITNASILIIRNKLKVQLVNFADYGVP